jgi:hypothetical protein
MKRILVSLCFVMFAISAQAELRRVQMTVFGMD